MRPFFLWLLLALLGVLVGVSRLNVNVDILTLLPDGLSEVDGLRQLRSCFEIEDELLLCVETSSPELLQPAAESLRTELNSHVDVIGSARPLGWGQDAGQAGVLLAWLMQNTPPAELAAWMEPRSDSNLAACLTGVVDRMSVSPDPGEVQRLGYDPLGFAELLPVDTFRGVMEAQSGLQLGAEGQMQVISVLPAHPLRNYKAAAPWLIKLRMVVDEWRKQNSSRYPGLRVSMTGEVAFMAETGAGMEHDLSTTLGASSVLIAALFWLMYRRLVPLLWIMALLAVVLGVTMGISAIVLGSINAMNLGFAAIVLGLVVDYGVLIYQEAAAVKLETDRVRSLRDRVVRSIAAAASSTVAVFLLLAFSHFPGLRELGVLVAIGVAVGACIMMTTFPSLALRHPIRAGVPFRSVDKQEWSRMSRIGRWAGGLVVLVFVGVLAIRGAPGFDGSSAPLRPKESEAMETLLRLERLGGRTGEGTTMPLLVVGEDGGALRARIRAVAAVAAEATDMQFWLPDALLPNVDAQAVNRKSIASFVDRRSELLRQIEEAGFTSESDQLFQSVCDALTVALQRPWPVAFSDSPAFPLLRRFIRSDAGGGSWAALGWVRWKGFDPDTGEALPQSGRKLLSQEGVYVPAWELLGRSLAHTARRDAFGRMLPLAALFLVLLYIIFRRWRDVLLAVACLAAGFVGLLALMALTGERWNLASIAALPLLVGTGIDYSIHMLMAMRREGGDARAVYRTTGRAVTFCALSSAIGFGSLTLAGNGGISSLGFACASGLLTLMVFAVGFLPAWYVPAAKSSLSLTPDS